MITAQPVGGDGEVAITFMLPPATATRGSRSLEISMTRIREHCACAGVDRPARLSVVLGSGRRYAFRYLSTNGRWFDDDQVVDFEPSGFGGVNGVIDPADGP